MRRWGIRYVAKEEFPEKEEYDGKGSHRWVFLVVAILIIVLFLLAGAWYYYTTHTESGRRAGGFHD